MKSRLMAPGARRAALPVAAALVVAASLSGCGDVERAGEAARVDGAVIPASDVETAVREIGAVPKFRSVTTAQVAQLLVYKQIAAPIAAQSGGVTNSMVAEKYPEFKGASQSTLDVLGTDMLLSTNLQGDPQFAKEFTAAASRADIEMNPRFGAVDRSEAGKLPLTGATFPWLKDGGAAPSPTASDQG